MMSTTPVYSGTPRAQRISSMATDASVVGMGGRSLTSPVAAAVSPTHVAISIPSHDSVDTATTTLPAHQPNLHRAGSYCSPRSIASSLSNRSSRMASANGTAQRPHRVIHSTTPIGLAELESTTVVMPSAQVPSSPPALVSNDSFALGATTGSLVLSPPTITSPNQSPSTHHALADAASMALPPASTLPTTRATAASTAAETPPSDDSARRAMIRRDARGNVTAVNGVSYEEAALRGGSSVGFVEMVALGLGLLSASLVLVFLALWYLATTRKGSNTDSGSTPAPGPSTCDTICPDTLRDLVIGFTVLFAASLITFTFLCRRRVSQGRRRTQALTERGLAVSTAKLDAGIEMDDLQKLASGSANSSSTLSRQALMAHDLALVPPESPFPRPLTRGASMSAASGGTAGVSRRPGTAHSATGHRPRASSHIHHPGALSPSAVAATPAVHHSSVVALDSVNCEPRKNM